MARRDKLYGRKVQDFGHFLVLYFEFDEIDEIWESGRTRRLLLRKLKKQR